VGLQRKLGNPELYRKSNEAIYNLEHADKAAGGKLADSTSSLRLYKTMATELTKARRTDFERVRKQ